MSTTRTIQLEMAGELRKIELTPLESPGRYQAIIDGKAVEIDAQLLEPGILSLLIGNRSYRCILSPGAEGPEVQVGTVSLPFRSYDPRSLANRRARTGGARGIQLIKAPMPGKVVRLVVEQGVTVKAHQGIVVIEAMKMQNELKAARAGSVTEVRVQPGDTVAAGQVLAVIQG